MPAIINKNMPSYGNAVVNDIAMIACIHCVTQSTLYIVSPMHVSSNADICSLFFEDEIFCDDVHIHIRSQ